MPEAVVDERRTRTEAARNGLRRPGQHGSLADILKTDDLQLGIPEPRLFGAKIADDAIECRHGIAGRDVTIIARA